MSISVSTARVDIEPPSRAPRRVRVLFLVEGFTDIRFVVGLSQICDLTMMVPAGRSGTAAWPSGWRRAGRRFA